MIEHLPRPPGRFAVALNAIWDVPGNAWRGMMKSAPFRQWAQSGAAIMHTLFAAGIVLILWLGPWSAAVEAKRLDGIVLICLFVLFIVLVSIVAMNGVGVHLKASRDGVDTSIGADEPAPVAQVQTTTTTTLTPAPVAAAPDTGELPVADRVQP